MDEDVRGYWERKILEWESSAYEGKAKSILEKIATPFRDSIKRRFNITINILKDFVKDKVVLDLGCGTGIFCVKIAKYEPRKVLGIDISSTAIREAKGKVQLEDLRDKIDFLCIDARRASELPKADIAVGLGFIDYLNRNELRELFNKMNVEYFWFSFPEKKISFTNILQTLYSKSQKCPGYNRFKRYKVSEIVPSRYNHNYVQKDGLVFLTNLPVV